MVFEDRAEAGCHLAERLVPWRGRDPVVLALPRGGVTVAAPIAVALAAPLDLVLVRKIGAPHQPELAIGAIVDGDRFIDGGMVARLGVTPSDVEAIVAREAAELARRRALYLGDRAPAPIAGRTAILVDDGIATGATMRIAIRAVKARGPAAVVVAVPVGARAVVERFRREVDACIALVEPTDFGGISEFYRDFRQLEDGEVMALLAAAP